MSQTNYGRHLSSSERIMIETGITNGSTKAAIAKFLGKDKSTIGKEIKKHRIMTYKCRLGMECAGYAKCTHDRCCRADCPDYKPYKCSRRDRTPGACNGCPRISKCRFNKYRYIADTAEHEYRDLLVNTRQGINSTVNNIKQLGELIKPYLKNGLSIYSILQANPQIKLCEKTIYNYIEAGVFQNAGVDIGTLDLRRFPARRKMTKKAADKYKLRHDRKYLQGRLFDDYQTYVAANPDARIVEMDTVYNDEQTGPFIQTFKFMQYHFMIAFLHPVKTSEEMYQGILALEKVIGPETFSKEVEVLLTDRGSEFTMADQAELRQDGTRRTRIFYCDPMGSRQKGSLENNHIELRYICPKGIDLFQAGLRTQADLNVVISNVNSFQKEKLVGKTPFQFMNFLNAPLAQKFFDFGITEIPTDKVILKPYLLKK